MHTTQLYLRTSLGVRALQKAQSRVPLLARYSGCELISAAICTDALGVPHTLRVEVRGDEADTHAVQTKLTGLI